MALVKKKGKRKPLYRERDVYKYVDGKLDLRKERKDKEWEEMRKTEQHRLHQKAVTNTKLK